MNWKLRQYNNKDEHFLFLVLLERKGRSDFCMYYLHACRKYFSNWSPINNASSGHYTHFRTNVETKYYWIQQQHLRFGLDQCKIVATCNCTMTNYFTQVLVSSCHVLPVAFLDSRTSEIHKFDAKYPLSMLLTLNFFYRHVFSIIKWVCWLMHQVCCIPN